MGGGLVVVTIYFLDRLRNIIEQINTKFIKWNVIIAVTLLPTLNFNNNAFLGIK